MTAIRDVFAQHTADSPAARRVFVGEPARAATSPTATDTATTAANEKERTAADLAAESYPDPYTRWRRNSRTLPLTLHRRSRWQSRRVA